MNRAMKLYLSAALIAVGPFTNLANATTIDSVGYGIEYDLGFGNARRFSVVDEELGGVTSINILNQELRPRPGIITTGSVRGDLATGSIGARSRILPDEDFLNSTSSTYAEITLRDTLTFDLTGTAAGSTVELDIGVDWEGFFTPFVGTDVTVDAANFSFGLVSEDDALEIRNARATVNTFLVPRNPDYEVGDTITFGDLGFTPNIPGLIGDWDSVDFLNGDFGGTFSLETGKVTNVDFLFRLQTIGNADFFNSAHLDFSSPVEFTSASGTFMTGGTVGVAEPATGLLLLGGLVGLFGRRRMRHSKM